MTYYPTKESSNWTVRHTRFAIKNGVKEVATNLWKYLLTLGKEGTKIDYILNDFQKYIKRLKGTPHDFGHVKKKFEQLIALGLISIVKSFGHNCYSLIVHNPRTLVLENQVRNYSENEGYIPKIYGPNTCNSEALSNSSSKDISTKNSKGFTDIKVGSEIDEVVKPETQVDPKERLRRLRIIRLCAKYNLLFNPNKPTTAQLYKYSIEEIEQSLELYKRRAASSYIENPKGWLITCLKYKFYEDYGYSITQFLTDMERFYKETMNVQAKM